MFKHKSQNYIKNLSKNTSNSFLKISIGSFHFNRLHHISAYHTLQRRLKRGCSHDGFF